MKLSEKNLQRNQSMITILEIYGMKIPRSFKVLSNTKSYYFYPDNFIERREELRTILKKKEAEIPYSFTQYNYSFELEKNTSFFIIYESKIDVNLGYEDYLFEINKEIRPVLLWFNYLFTTFLRIKNIYVYHKNAQKIKFERIIRRNIDLSLKSKFPLEQFPHYNNYSYNLGSIIQQLEKNSDLIDAFIILIKIKIYGNEREYIMNLFSILYSILLKKKSINIENVENDFSKLDYKKLIQDVENYNELKFNFDEIYKIYLRVSHKAELVQYSEKIHEDIKNFFYIVESILLNTIGILPDIVSLKKYKSDFYPYCHHFKWNRKKENETKAHYENQIKAYDQKYGKFLGFEYYSLENYTQMSEYDYLIEDIFQNQLYNFIPQDMRTDFNDGYYFEKELHLSKIHFVHDFSFSAYILEKYTSFSFSNKTLFFMKLNNMEFYFNSVNIASWVLGILTKYDIECLSIDIRRNGAFDEIIRSNQIVNKQTAKKVWIEFKQPKEQIFLYRDENYNYFQSTHEIKIESTNLMKIDKQDFIQNIEKILEKDRDYKILSYEELKLRLNNFQDYSCAKGVTIPKREDTASVIGIFYIINLKEKTIYDNFTLDPDIYRKYIKYFDKIETKKIEEKENYIDSLNVNGIGPFENVNMKLNPNFNLIFGKNGSGKSFILKCLSLCYNLEYIDRFKSIKNNAECFLKAINYQDEFFLGFNETPKRIHKDLTLKKLIGNSTAFKPPNRVIIPLFIGTYRTIINTASLTYYRKNKRPIFTYDNLISSLDFPLKNWLYERIKLNFAKEINSDIRSFNYEWMKKKIEKLIPDYDFEIKFEILSDLEFNQKKLPNFEIYFKIHNNLCLLENLPSGYQSVFAIIFEIINWIEQTNEIGYINRASGTVIIDEIENHLHPEWQLKIREGLKLMFPNIQFVIITHSPLLLSTAKTKEIILLNKDPTKNNQLIPSLNSYAGWKIHDIIYEIMDVEQLYDSDYYKLVRKAFNIKTKRDIPKLRKLINQIEKIANPKDSIIQVLELKIADLYIKEE